MRRFIGVLWIVLISQFSSAQTSLAGFITDAKTGDLIIIASVSLFQNDIVVKRVETDFDGLYLFSKIKPGVYNVEVSYIGYTSTMVVDVIIKENWANRLNVVISEAVLMDDIVIKDYVVPLIDLDESSQGMTVTDKSISSLPTRGVSDIATTAAGISTNPDQISIRSARSVVTEYYLDGIKMRGNPPSFGNIQIISQPSVQDNLQQETYESTPENYFRLTTDEALSTFSIDVDCAAYSNLRRMINQGNLPPQDAIRIEEMINYFDYNYEGPKNNKLFEIHHELSKAPWNDHHDILQIALKGERIDMEELPASNFVFLIDVSGSMSSSNKLGLVKSSMKLMIGHLDKKDKVAIVVYAGSAGLVLESTAASEKNKILNAIDNLSSGGSTAGGAGIKLAYKTAKENYIKGGNNRIVLATDGDFNVGVNNPDDLESLIEKERNEGVFLSVLGYGMGNYRDDMMQRLADKGNGNHNYIDNIQEARKVLISEFAGTMYTLAKDVKIQIEFNPAYVKAYRLIGYTNRMLQKEDFNDDKKDAGELGKGHSVTALYELIPVGENIDLDNNVDELKYQKPSLRNIDFEDELCTIKLRYKAPESDESRKIVKIVKHDSKMDNISERMNFAMAVAGFGMILSDSEYKKDLEYNHIIALAKANKTYDPEGYKSEFVRMVESCKILENSISMKE